MQRALQTAIHMFKNHPNLSKIQFIVLPIVREVLETSNDLCMDIESTVQKYAIGSDICEGLKFNFAMIYLYGIPKLWQVYTLASLPKQKDIITSLKVGVDGGPANLQEVMLQRLASHEPRFENHFDLYERAKIIKDFMREYLIANPLDHEQQYKYGIISHSRTMATLSASGVSAEGELLDFYWMKNCEIRPFFDY